MTKLPKCFIGSYMKNGGSINQKNGIYTNQKSFKKNEGQFQLDSPDFKGTG